MSIAYLTKAKEAFCVARAECQAIISRGATSSRSKEQGPVYLNVLNDSISGTPITAAEYLPASEYPRNTFVLCSTAEARRILKAGSPKIPILIPAEWNQDRNTLSIAQFLEYLKSFATVDIHDFDQALPDGVITPRSIDPSSALALFRDPARGPVNMLNLGAYKENPIPSCMAGLPAYGIMTQAKEQSGKLEHPVVLDLSDSARFQLCAKRGTFSMPHIDRHGVLTTVFNDEGQKLWPFWPASEVPVWAPSNALPAEPGIGLYLDPGSTLIQPQGTIHAPYSLTDVLMSGTMHWDSREMLGVMQFSELERRYPHITNEDPAHEFEGKVDRIGAHWQAQLPTWPWGPGGHLRQYLELVKGLKTRRHKPPAKPRRKRR